MLGSIPAGHRAPGLRNMVTDDPAPNKGTGKGAANGSTAGAPFDPALAYLGAGLSVIPVPPDGSKQPSIKWKRLQQELMPEVAARAWWKNGTNGIAVIGGRVSGGAECIDFDQGELFEQWQELVEAQAPGLVD